MAEPQAPTPRNSRRRSILIHALIVVTTVLAVVAMMSIWANRLLFNPDNWENASTQLLQNDKIRGATANYLVDQLYANVDVAGLLKQGLPPRLDPLAGPAAGALQNAAVQAVDLLLSRPKVQTLWAKANRAADQTFIDVVNGRKGPVGVKQGAVTLDLVSIVNTIAARLGLPSDLGSKLPGSVANLTVFKSNQLKAVQNIGNAVKGLALWLTIFCPILFGAAILLSRARRRTLMTVGFAIVFAGVIGFAVRQILISQITDSLVSDASLRPAVREVVTIATQILGTISGAYVLVGAIVAVAAWFAGPARIVVVARRAIAPFLREEPVWTFAIVAAVMVAVFIWQPIPATGTFAGIVTFFALAMLGTELLRRQTAVEFPDAQRGDASAALRARWRASREGRPAAATPQSLAQELERLAALREQNAITDEEYGAAKARLMSAPA